MSDQRYRILLVEDHKLLLEGIRSLLSKQDDLEVVGEAHSVSDAEETLVGCQPDLAVVDLSLVNSRGIDFVRHLATEHPEVRILVFSHRPAWLMGERMLAAGAHGYLQKSPHDLQIVEAIRTLMGGQVFLSDGEPEDFCTSSEYVPLVRQLSDREFDVFELLGQGQNSTDIAKRIEISASTVRTLLDRIKEKLQLEGADEVRRVALAWQLDAAL